jgi:hypothetical protein
MTTLMIFVNKRHLEKLEKFISLLGNVKANFITENVLLSFYKENIIDWHTDMQSFMSNNYAMITVDLRLYNYLVKAQNCKFDPVDAGSIKVSENGNVNIATAFPSNVRTRNLGCLVVNVFKTLLESRVVYSCTEIA